MPLSLHHGWKRRNTSGVISTYSDVSERWRFGLARQSAVEIDFKENKNVPEEDGWPPQAGLSSAVLYVNAAPSLLYSSSG